MTDLSIGLSDPHLSCRILCQPQSIPCPSPEGQGDPRALLDLNTSHDGVSIRMATTQWTDLVIIHSSSLFFRADFPSYWRPYNDIDPSDRHRLHHRSVDAVRMRAEYVCRFEGSDGDRHCRKPSGNGVGHHRSTGRPRTAP